MPVYQKLVRDSIPDIIQRDGKTCRTRILDEQEYRMALEAKFVEEWDEYRKAGNASGRLEELADVLEVMLGLLEVDGGTPEQLERQRQAKAAERGAFRRRVLLIDADD